MIMDSYESTKKANLNRGTIPNQGVSNQGVPNQGVTYQGAPNQGVPNQGAPNQAFPNQGVPNQGAPNQGVPNQAFPNPAAFGQGSNAVNKAEADALPNPENLGQPIRSDKLENKAVVLTKKEKMERMKEFLNLRRKVNFYINQDKAEEAKNTYDTLYSLYIDMTKSFQATEIAVVKKDIVEMYNKLKEAVNKKRVKKGHFQEVEKTDDDKNKHRKKIVTTDLDVIMQIIEEKGKLGLADIQARFNVSKVLAEEWVQTLADYGLVNIKYLPIGGVEITKVEIAVESK